MITPDRLPRRSKAMLWIHEIAGSVPPHRRGARQHYDLILHYQLRETGEC